MEHETNIKLRSSDVSVLRGAARVCVCCVCVCACTGVRVCMHAQVWLCGG